MATTLLLAALALGQAPSDKGVTAAEKKEFFALLAKLPVRGEFYTDEAVDQAVPYTRVLLALTEKDLQGRDPYPLLALSRGLVERKTARQYGVANFARIAHPMLKLFWASVLFDEAAAPPEVIAFLHRALATKEDARLLALMAGGGFEDFKDRVTRAYDAGRQRRVELLKQHPIDGLPASGTLGYSDRSCVLLPGPRLLVVRAAGQKGELITYRLGQGITSRRTVPQPAGFKAQYDFSTYFEHPALSVSAAGGLVCRWTIGGNGDHGLAALPKGAADFQVRRVDLALADSYVRADPDGAWYLIRGGPRFTVYRLDKDLRPKRLGEFAGKGHHSIRIADARFIAKDVLHLFWSDVLPGGNFLRVRCVDFDVRTRQWLHDREIFRLDQFVSSASGPTVLQLADGSLHYLWRVDQGQNPGAATGVYYQAEADGKTVKVADGYEYRAVAMGDAIVLCYAVESAPEKVSFRVIRRGVPGPSTAITTAKGQKHGVWSENLLLHTEADRVWFINGLDTTAAYELRVVDTEKQ